MIEELAVRSSWGIVLAYEAVAAIVTFLLLMLVLLLL